MRNVTVIDCAEPRRDGGDILRILSELNVDICYVEDHENSFTVAVSNNVERAKILDPTLREELLSNHDLKVCKPADYRAACTLVASRHNQVIRRIGGMEFKRRFEEAANTKIDYVGMMGPSCYKIEFFSVEEAQRIREIDIEFEDVCFPANSLDTLRFIKVPQCTKCFSFLHEHKDCTSSESYCLICGQAGHTKIFCPDRNNPKCKNCFGNHVAIAFKCPFRKVREYELDRERGSIRLDLLEQVCRAKRIAAGLDPDGSEGEEDIDGSVGGPDPYATDEEDEEGDAQRPQSVHREQNEGSSEGATALQTSSFEDVTTTGETSAPSVPPQRPTFEELKGIIAESLSIISDQLNTRGYTIASERTRTAASFIRDYRGIGDDNELQQLQPSSSSATWRSARIVRAPDPNQGEGPRRQLRRIPNYKEPEPAIPRKEPPVADYPVLPKRKLRRCADAENSNPLSGNNPPLVS